MIRLIIIILVVLRLMVRVHLGGQAGIHVQSALRKVFGLPKRLHL